jgi:hypothetical protein
VISIVQGDSYGQDIQSVPVAEFGVGFTGKWALVKTIGALATISGDLTKSVDLKTFYLRILPAQTEALTLGKYYLVVQVENTATNFKQEIQQAEFTVTKQGIPG